MLDLMCFSMSLKSGMLRSSTFSPFLSVMTMSPQSPTPRPMAMKLDIATKGLREMIIKQNMRDFRKEQTDKEARRSKEYGRVLYEVRR